MASRYLVAGGTGNWNSTTNWSATSGGASGASFPTSADDVFLDAASGATNITVNVASACLSLTVNNAYTGTLTMSNTLTVTTNGSVTLGTGMTIAGTGTLTIAGNCTLTSNSVTWGRPISLTGNGSTYSFVNNWQVTDFSVSNGGSANTSAFNGSTLSISGNCTIAASISGTLNFVLNGTGTVNFSLARSCGNNLEINTGGTITFASTVYMTNSKTLLYTAGTTNASSALSVSGITNGSTFTLTGWTQILDLTVRGNSVVTLSNNMTCRDLLTVASDGGTGNVLNGFTLSITRNVNVSQIASGRFSGTTVLQMVGTGTITTGAAPLSNDIVINTSGTISLSGLILYGLGQTITHTSGTINPASSVVTRSVAGTLTFNISTSGFQLFSMTVPNTGATTVNTSALSMTGTLLCSGSATFNGTAGITMANLTAGTAAATLTWQSGITYTCNTAMTVSGTNVSPINFYASVVNGTKAIFTLVQGASQSNFFVNARDIDSGAGQTIYDALGTTAVLTRTINWNDGTRPRTRVGIYC